MTEDLSTAYWPAAGAANPGGGTSTVWRPGDIDVLRRTLDRLRRAPLPVDLPRTTSWPGPQWPRVIELADQLIDVGVVARSFDWNIPRHTTGAGRMSRDSGAWSLASPRTSPVVREPTAH